MSWQTGHTILYKNALTILIEHTVMHSLPYRNLDKQPCCEITENDKSFLIVESALSSFS